MRGKVRHILNAVQNVGITPAYAGKRLVCKDIAPLVRDHPRVCGEKLARLYSSVPVPGSPPHMRGKAPAPLGSTPTAGITPAYAGKSATLWHFIPVLWDHPRVCGEKTTANPQATDHWGSPPHMRGKGSPTDTTRHFFRITPACAGKSLVLGLKLAQGRDHPRVCGEN